MATLQIGTFAFDDVKNVITKGDNVYALPNIENVWKGAELASAGNPAMFDAVLASILASAKKLVKADSVRVFEELRSWMNIQPFADCMVAQNEFADLTASKAVRWNVDVITTNHRSDDELVLYSKSAPDIAAIVEDYPEDVDVVCKWDGDKRQYVVKFDEPTLYAQGREVVKQRGFVTAEIRKKAVEMGLPEPAVEYDAAGRPIFDDKKTRASGVVGERTVTSHKSRVGHAKRGDITYHGNWDEMRASILKVAPDAELVLKGHGLKFTPSHFYAAPSGKNGYKWLSFDSAWEDELGTSAK